MVMCNVTPKFCENSHTACAGTDVRRFDIVLFLKMAENVTGF
jgi:hypothetical protein